MLKHNSYTYTLLLVLLLIFASGHLKASEKADREIFDAKKVHEIRIYFLQPNAWDSLIDYKTRDELKQYMQATVVFNGKPYYAVGVRLKGQSSFDFSHDLKKSFKVKFNEYISGQTVHGISTINLNNNFNDPTMIREKLLFDILRMEGLPAPRTAHAAVYLNDKYLGLFTLVEQINRRFLENEFGNADGSLYEGEPRATFEELGTELLDYKRSYTRKFSENNLDDLLDLIRAINKKGLSDSDYAKQLEKHLNVESVLKIWAITNIFYNSDAYNTEFVHNFFIYRNSTTKRFEWIPFDGNNAFNTWNPRHDLDKTEKLSILYIADDGVNRPLQTALFQHKIYRQFYLDYARNLLTQRLTEPFLIAMVDDLTIRVRRYIYEDPYKMFTNEDFEKSIYEHLGDVTDPGAYIPGLKPFIKARRNNILTEINQITGE
jgi:spore coat protein H